MGKGLVVAKALGAGALGIGLLAKGLIGAKGKKKPPPLFALPPSTRPTPTLLHFSTPSPPTPPNPPTLPFPTYFFTPPIILPLHKLLPLPHLANSSQSRSPHPLFPLLALVPSSWRGLASPCSPAPPLPRAGALAPLRSLLPLNLTVRAGEVSGPLAPLLSLLLLQSSTLLVIPHSSTPPSGRGLVSPCSTPLTSSPPNPPLFSYSPTPPLLHSKSCHSSYSHTPPLLHSMSSHSSHLPSSHSYFS